MPMFRFKPRAGASPIQAEAEILETVEVDDAGSIRNKEQVRIGLFR